MSKFFDRFGVVMKFLYDFYCRCLFKDLLLTGQEI